MGETVSAVDTNDFASGLSLIERVEDKHFGPIDIYRMKEPHYEYIMDFKKNFIEDNDRMNRYISQMREIKKMEHKNLSKIHAVDMCEGNHGAI